MRGPAQTSEPTIQFLYQLVDALREGRLLIPRFQRPLVWGWDRQSELLRSVRDGIPMGAIMIWRTSRDRVAWRDELAGHALPAPLPGNPRQYLLDGLQRLSTLFAALRGFGTASADDGDARSPLGYDLEEEEFVESFDPAAQPQIVPLELLLDSITLLRFQRGLTGSQADTWIQRSDELAKAFREYKVPVIPIVSDEFEVAARTFNLLNSQGVRMEEADMIHALTWTPEFELRDKIESLRAEILQPVGWGDIDLDTVLKVVKAEADLDLYAESVEAVSGILKTSPDTLDRAFAHLARAAELLRTHCGVWSWELVPYAVQAVLIADALRLADSQAANDLLADWFWLTTYGEMFAGFSGYRLGVAIRDLRECVQDGQMRWSSTSPIRVRPLPQSSDLRAVRMKAVALMLAREIKASNPAARDPFQLLAEQRRNALFALIPRQLLARGMYSSPGNRVLCDPAVAMELRQRVLSGQLTPLDRAEHLISDAADAAARAGDWERFVMERMHAIEKREARFLMVILNRHPSV